VRPHEERIRQTRYLLDPDVTRHSPQGVLGDAARQERSWHIGHTASSPLAATGVLSLGLLLPFGAGAFNDRVVTTAKNLMAEVPTKHVTFVRNGLAERIQTRAATVDDLLAEAGIVRASEDAISSDPATSLTDGATVVYRAALPVTLVVDGVARDIRTPAATVRELLASQAVGVTAHDRVSPMRSAVLTSDVVVRVTHVTSWTERVRQSFAPPVQHVFAFDIAPGKQRVVDPGMPGTKELTLAYSQPDRAIKAQRTFLAVRIVRAPHARVIAEGIGEYASFAHFARHGIDGTLRLAKSALTMMATAYTRDCAGCSGYTAIGRLAGHGIVAVDPHVIPLGTRLFIPGYGAAVAGDTGGAIRGNRIDLGFNSRGDARSFGRRPITVYVLK
jgi:uncharacterized protein YabE (DUF348 family)/3D (Asp-Asp-Asp) domain-containing protein